MAILNKYMRRQLRSETTTYRLGNSRPHGMPDTVRLSGNHAHRRAVGTDAQSRNG